MDSLMHENLKRLILSPDKKNSTLALRILKGQGYSNTDAEYYVGMTKWADRYRHKKDLNKKVFKISVAGRGCIAEVSGDQVLFLDDLIDLMPKADGIK